MLGIYSSAKIAPAAATAVDDDACRLPALRDHPVARSMGPPRAHDDRPT
jgi:hypothetical protein